MTSVPKSGWTEDKYIEEAMELFKLEGKGKRLGKEFIFNGCWRILKEAPKWKGGCGYVRDHSKLKLDDLKYELRPMGEKAAKNEKHVANAQLVIEQKHVMMLERKVKTQRDEFLFKIFSMNSESAEAKRWFAMKAQEAMEDIDAAIGKPAAKKAKKDILEFSSSAEVDVSTSPSASTDDDESILETEQLEF